MKKVIVFTTLLILLDIAFSNPVKQQRYEDCQETLKTLGYRNRHVKKYYDRIIQEKILDTNQGIKHVMYKFEKLKIRRINILDNLRQHTNIIRKELRLVNKIQKKLGNY